MPIHALIADDNAVVQDLLGRFLEDRGFAVQTVADGEAALQAVRTHEFEVLFLDVYLPKMSGLDVLYRLRSEGLDTTVFAMSGLPDDQMVRDCLDLGAADFLSKPLDLRRIEFDLREQVTAHE